ncbi:hypothetical protein EYS14_05450 [Alteromonadaceae bacterium M269]|nr:hypothetical protein EYS14_05450 [Alteromonadaceae bacterium M269]
MAKDETIQSNSESDKELSKKDRVDLLIKEYEIHRREIDIRTDGTKNYGWPVFMALVLLTVALSRKEDLPPVAYDLLPLVVPLIFMVVLALDANAKEAMDKARLQMARIEKKIKDVLGYYLFDAEMTRVIKWGRPRSKARVIGYTVAWCALYLFLIFF